MVDVEAKVLEHDKQIVGLNGRVDKLECLMEKGIKGIKEDTEEIKTLFTDQNKHQSAVNKDLYEKIETQGKEQNKKFSGTAVVAITALTALTTCALGILGTVLAMSVLG